MPSQLGGQGFRMSSWFWAWVGRWPSGGTGGVASGSGSNCLLQSPEESPATGATSNPMHFGYEPCAFSTGNANLVAPDATFVDSKMLQTKITCPRLGPG